MRGQLMQETSVESVQSVAKLFGIREARGRFARSGITGQPLYPEGRGRTKPLSKVCPI